MNVKNALVLLNVAVVVSALTVLAIVFWKKYEQKRRDERLSRMINQLQNDVLFIFEILDELNSSSGASEKYDEWRAAAVNLRERLARLSETYPDSSSGTLNDIQNGARRLYLDMIIVPVVEKMAQNIILSRRLDG